MVIYGFGSDHFPPMQTLLLYCIMYSRRSRPLHVKLSCSLQYEDFEAGMGRNLGSSGCSLLSASFVPVVITMSKADWNIIKVCVFQGVICYDIAWYLFY